MPAIGGTEKRKGKKLFLETEINPSLESRQAEVSAPRQGREGKVFFLLIYCFPRRFEGTGYWCWQASRPAHKVVATLGTGSSARVGAISMLYGADISVEVWVVVVMPFLDGINDSRLMGFLGESSFSPYSVLGYTVGLGCRYLPGKRYAVEILNVMVRGQRKGPTKTSSCWIYIYLDS